MELSEIECVVCRKLFSNDCKCDSGSIWKCNNCSRTDKGICRSCYLNMANSQTPPNRCLKQPEGDFLICDKCGSSYKNPKEFMMNYSILSWTFYGKTNAKRWV